VADVRPFRALRPPPDRAARVSAPPYDVMDVDEARTMAAGNPDSFLHVSRPEIDLPADIDPYHPQVYRQGRQALQDFVHRGLLVPDETSGYLVYEQRWGSARQTGLVGCAAVADYESGLIRTHEHTRPDKEEDRVRHVDALGAHDEPVFLIAPPTPDLAKLVDEVTALPPTYDFTTDDGVGHTLWPVTDPDQVAALRAALAALPRLYVADGHHRSAAAVRVHRLRADRRPHQDTVPHREDEAFLAVVFPSDQVRILPYNRVVADLAGATPSALLDALGDRFEVTASATPVEPDRRHDVGVYLAGQWYRLRARPGLVDETDPVGRLDVTVLQEQVLAPLLGVQDPRTDRRIRFVGGIRGIAELQRLVDGGGAAVAFSLHPTSVEELLAVADAGTVMPPKSTWFEPKLRSGLFIHPLDAPVPPTS
jgi:uncharacterized protein (DUF1015 family)